MESAAATPVMAAVRATSAVFCKAKVSPARTPISSTRASFRPRTIDPVYLSLSSSSRVRRACSCSSSSRMMPLISLNDSGIRL